MDEVIQIITKTELPTEETLVEALTAQGKDESTIQAAVAVARTFAGFRDSLDEADLASIAKSLGFGEEETEVEVEADTQKTEDESDTDVTEETDDTVAKVEEEESVEKSEETDAEIDELKGRIAELESQGRMEELHGMVDGFNIGKSTDELAEVLKAVDDAAIEGGVEKVLEAFKAANEVIRLGGFNEIGSDMPGLVGGDAYDKIKARANQIMKSDGVDFSHAMKKVEDTDPELVEEYYKQTE